MQGETKVLSWICESCDSENLREVPQDKLIFDDQCDICEKKIHEPITRVKAKN
jgi:hypothetical protein